MRRVLCFVFFLSSLHLAAQQKTWSCGLLIRQDTIRFELVQEKGGEFYIRNGEEKVLMEKLSESGDSVKYALSVFDAFLIFPKRTGATFGGWYRKGDAKVPSKGLAFLAGIPARKVLNTGSLKVEGSWPLEFLEGDVVKDKGILVLRQRGNQISGSILTETGDYRFLNGEISGRSGYLHTFDGGHAWFFRLNFSESGQNLEGSFVFSQTGAQRFRGVKQDGARLASGFSEGKEGLFRFSGLDAGGNRIGMEAFRGKGLVLQVMGTWCPNCLDETKFLVEEFASRPANVEFAGLAFERGNDANYAQQRIATVKRKLLVPYPVYWGGNANKDSASAALPDVGGIKAFPTTVFVKSDGRILKVHSGFSGPATGDAYEAWRKEFRELLKQLNP